MEDALRVKDIQWYVYNHMSLNPYSDGRCAKSSKTLLRTAAVVLVLILILMEDELRDIYEDLFSIRERANEHSSYTNILPFSQKKSVFLLWVITSTFMLCPIILMDLSRSVAALSHYIEILC